MVEIQELNIQEDKQMITRKKILKGLGLILFGSTLMFPRGGSAEEFKLPYGTLMLAQPDGRHLSLQYDTDGDDKSDLYMHYDLIGKTREGKLVYKLNFVREDLNRDGFFTKDETTYRNPKNPSRSFVPKEKQVEI